MSIRSRSSLMEGQERLIAIAIFDMISRDINTPATARRPRREREAVTRTDHKLNRAERRRIRLAEFGHCGCSQVSTTTADWVVSGETDVVLFETQGKQPWIMEQGKKYPFPQK